MPFHFHLPTTPQRLALPTINPASISNSSEFHHLHKRPIHPAQRKLPTEWPPKMITNQPSTTSTYINPHPLTSYYNQTNKKPIQHSQSQRILWLLEELQIPYNLILHERNPITSSTRPLLSPESLITSTTYSKSPLLLTSPFHGSIEIPESSAIATYLLRTYDLNDKFGLQKNWLRDEILTSMILSNLIRATSFLLYLDLGSIQNGNSKRFDGEELRKVLGDLEGELKKSPKGGFFNGETPGRADFLMEFPLSMVKGREWCDLDGEFPALAAWLEKVYKREAWKRGLEKGNGYDWSVFPKRARL